jgi:membrane protein
MMLWQLLRETFREWRDDRATLQGAALAFYALFSSAPLLIVATAVLGLIFGQEAAERKLAEELVALTTPEVARAVQALVADAGRAGTGFAAGAAGVGMSLYGASRGFFHLQATLNQIWGVQAVRGPGVVEIVRRKLLAFASVALCGALLLVSTGASIGFHVAARHAAQRLSLGFRMLRLGEEMSTYGFVVLLLMVVYKTLPDVRIRWRDVLVGAAVSAALFVLGKHLVSFYLRHVSVGSSFGAASALAAVMIYYQYMAQVLLFGAEFTYVFARMQGRPIEPGAYAARVMRITVP